MTVNKRSQFILPLFFSMLMLCASAQTDNATPWHRGILSHLDMGVNVGTTGLGVTLSLPVADRFTVRAGIDAMPHMIVPMGFDLMSYAGDADGSNDLSQEDKFNKMASFMESFTGIKVDRHIDMHAKPLMVDAKVLVDFYPLRDNRHWHVTAGFYWGNSRVGHIENTINEAPSLMGVIIYNKFYDYFRDDRFYDEPLIEGFPLLDPVYCWDMKAKFMRYGRVGAHVGDFRDVSPALNGLPYLMEPDESGTVQADMYVNHFKPYLGIGYQTAISKDGRWNVGFDAGALFWGKPSILTHERYIESGDEIVGYGKIPEDWEGYTYGRHIDLATDVTDIGGKVGTYVDIAKTLHVYPVLNLKISYKLF